MRLDFWNSSKEKVLVGLGILYSHEQGEEKQFLFGVPSKIEQQRTRKGLRLMGGMAEKGESPIDALFRELHEEVLGHQLDNSSVDRQAVLALLERKKAELVDELANRGPVAPHMAHRLPPYIYEHKPDRSNPAQKDWLDTRNYVYPIRLSKSELELLQKVAKETVHLEEKDKLELSDAVIHSQSSLGQLVTNGRPFVYKGEQNALARFIDEDSGQPRGRLFRHFRYH